MNKKSIIVIILVGIICLGLGAGGSYLLFSYNKSDYNEIKEELDELKNKEKKIHKAQLENGENIILTLKNGNISTSDLYDLMKETNGIDSLLNLVDKKILEEEYSDKIEEANDYVDGIIKYYESVYGIQLLSVLKSNGYASVDEFRNIQYVSYLQELAIKDYCKEQITDKEVEKYYKEEVVGDIKISHILITANTTDDMTASERVEAENKAKAQAEAIIEELNKVNKSEVADVFAKLAKEQSQDEITKSNGGSFGYINKNTLSSSYDDLVNAAYKLKDGEYSKEVIKTELGYHVILRTETKEKASLEVIKEDILDNLGNKYLEKNHTAYIKGMDKIRKEYDLLFIDTELEKQYSNYIQNLIKAYEYQQKLQEQQNQN